MFKKIIHTGESTDFSFEKNLSICLSNILALQLNICGFIYAIISFIYFPELIIQPLQAALIALAVIFFNSIGFIKSSRIMLSIFGVIMASLFQGALVSDVELFYYPILLCQIGMSLTPLVIFTKQEKTLKYTPLLFNFILLCLQPLINSNISLNENAHYIHNGILNQATYVCGVFFILVPSLLLWLKKIEIKRHKKSHSIS